MWRQLKYFFALFHGLSLVGCKVFDPCEIATEVRNLVVTIGREIKPVDCSAEDTLRLVCMASLHNFTSSYSYKTANSTSAVGVFGIPTKHRCARSGLSDKFQDNFNCLMWTQFLLSESNMSLVSEVICKHFYSSVEDYIRVMDKWNITDRGSSTEMWVKRTVTCKKLGMKFYVADESLKRAYKPGILHDPSSYYPNRGEAELSMEKECKDRSYCMNYCASLREDKDYESWKRTHKKKEERKVNKFAKIVDWTIIVIWILVVSGVLAAGYLFIRNPRRRRDRHDDWNSPVLTAHFVQ